MTDLGDDLTVILHGVDRVGRLLPQRDRALSVLFHPAPFEVHDGEGVLRDRKILVGCLLEPLEGLSHVLGNAPSVVEQQPERVLRPGIASGRCWSVCCDSGWVGCDSGACD
jgi:hypothetical protein